MSDTRRPAPRKSNSGRPRKRIKGVGPVQDLALAMRAVSQGHTREAIAEALGITVVQLRVIDGGDSQPSWPSTEQYLTACGVSQADLAGWQQRHAAAADHAGKLATAEPGVVTSRDALRATLDATLADVGAGRDVLSARRERLLALDRSLQVPEVEELLTGPADPGTVEWAMRLAGASEEVVDTWRSRAAEVSPAEPSAPPARRARWPLYAVAVAAVVVLVPVLVVVNRWGSGGPAKSSHKASALPSGAPEPRPSGDAARTVGDLAAQYDGALAAVRVDGQAQLHRRSYEFAAEGSDTPTVVRDERLEWCAAESGVRGRRTTQVVRGGRTTAPEVEDLAPGPPEETGPPSADPIVLKEHLSRRLPGRAGPVELLRVAAELHDVHPLSDAEHAAWLRVVAAVDGLALRGQYADGAGRTGVGVSVDDADGTRFVLILAPVTGRLLGWEENVAAPHGGRIIRHQVAYLEARFVARPS